MYTVKDLLESSENLQIRLIGKNLGGGVDREIKGIRINGELVDTLECVLNNKQSLK